jgi:hypothetical protein
MVVRKILRKVRAIAHPENGKTAVAEAIMVAHDGKLSCPSCGTIGLVRSSHIPSKSDPEKRVKRVYRCRLDHNSSVEQFLQAHGDKEISLLPSTCAGLPATCSPVERPPTQTSEPLPQNPPTEQGPADYVTPPLRLFSSQPTPISASDVTPVIPFTPEPRKRLRQAQPSPVSLSPLSPSPILLRQQDRLSRLEESVQFLQDSLLETRSALLASREEISEHKAKISNQENIINLLTNLLKIHAPNVVPNGAYLDTNSTGSTPSPQPSPQVTLQNISTNDFPAALRPTITITNNNNNNYNNSKKSFADLVRNIKSIPEDQVADVAKDLARLHHRPRFVGRLTKTSSAGLVCVYVEKIAFMKISQVKSILFNLRIKMSNILNISYIGRKFVEITTVKEYADTLSERLTALDFIVHKNFDPTVAYNPNATEELRRRVEESGLERIRRISETCPDLRVKEHFASWYTSERQKKAQRTPVEVLEVLEDGEEQGEEVEIEVEVEMEVEEDDEDDLTISGSTHDQI